MSAIKNEKHCERHQAVRDDGLNEIMMMSANVQYSRLFFASFSSILWHSTITSSTVCRDCSKTTRRSHIKLLSGITIISTAYCMYLYRSVQRFFFIMIKNCCFFFLIYFDFLFEPGRLCIESEFKFFSLSLCVWYNYLQLESHLVRTATSLLIKQYVKIRWR